jgi:hypothetical protein
MFARIAAIATLAVTLLAGAHAFTPAASAATNVDRVEDVVLVAVNPCSGETVIIYADRILIRTDGQGGFSVTLANARAYIDGRTVQVVYLFDPVGPDMFLVRFKLVGLYDERFQMKLGQDGTPFWTHIREMCS